MTIKDTLLALAVVIIWGINFSVIKIGLEELPPILFSAFRFAIVAIPAVFFIQFPKTSIWNVLGVGVFLGVFKFGCLFIAMKADASAGISSLLLQAQVFFTIGLSILFYKEIISKSQLLGVLLAVLGFSLFFLNTGGSITVFGLVLILLAGLFWAISNIIMKQIKGVNLLNFMVWVCLVPPIPLLLLSYFTETTAPLDLLLSSTINTWGALIYVSFISTLLAFAIWGKLLTRYPAVTVAPFALLIPVAGILSSSIVLNESMSTTEYIGGALIMLGLVFCVMGNKIVEYLLAGYNKQFKRN